MPIQSISELFAKATNFLIPSSVPEANNAIVSTECQTFAVGRKSHSTDAIQSGSKLTEVATARQVSDVGSGLMCGMMVY